MFYSFGFADLQIVPVGGNILMKLCLVGLFGTLSHLCMNYAVRFAPSATLAPMQYIELPVATTIGLVVFDELPNMLAAIGISISVGAGLASSSSIARRSARQPPNSPLPPGRLAANRLMA